MSGPVAEVEKIPIYIAKGLRHPQKPPREHPQDILRSTISEIMNTFLPDNLLGTNILVKPNLLKAGDPLCVTPPETILATATILKDMGAKVMVADSPAFGTAKKVLKSLGIINELQRRGIEVSSLKDPVRKRLPCGIRIGISRTALEAGLIVNIPRLKAHCQMGVTAAVKNTFGTVVGFRKAMAHTLYGGDRALFSAMILEISQLLPPGLNMVDATTIMHVTGPSGGKPLSLGLILASPSAVAVDTSAYHILGLAPGQVPLWHTALERNLYGSRLEDLRFIKEDLRAIQLPTRVSMPKDLQPLTFNPMRLLRGRIKSLLKKLF